MLKKITNLYQDNYYVWQAKRWIKYKSEGALKAVSDYFVYSALGVEMTFCEHWHLRMGDADDKINGLHDLRTIIVELENYYDNLRENLIELGCPTEDEVLEELSNKE